MAHIVEHLSVEELGRRARTSEDACAARHYQAFWLLAQGQTVAEVATVTGFVSRWLEQLARRYNQFGPDALGDRCHRNGPPGFCPPSFWTACAHAWRRSRPMAEPGPPPRSPPGWPRNSASPRSTRNAPGTRCRRSAGRSRRRVPRTRPQPPPKSRPPSKKIRRHPRRGRGAPSRAPGRAFLHPS